MTRTTRPGHDAPRTLFDKLWTSRAIADLGDGMTLLQVDRLVLQDVSGGTVMREMLDAGHTVACPAQVFVISDHLATTAPGVVPRIGWTPQGIKVLDEVSFLARSLGVTHIDQHDARGGIAHVVAPELAIALPGLAIACGDSHTCTLGGLGALAWGIGTSEGSHALATQTLVQQRPRSMRIVFKGELRPGVTAKDMALALIARVGAGFGAGHAVEFAGPAVRALSVEARMTLCNMAIEFSAKYGFVAPDEKTFEYLRGRPYAPRGDAWERATAYWRTLATDEGAGFDTEVVIDASALSPQVTWGTSPQHACAVKARVPAPSSFADGATRQLAERALAYQQLAPGTALESVAIDVAYIGTCTNARLSDLRVAAAVLKGHKVAPHVTAICVPGSEQVKAQAEAEGLDRIFIDAGFEWHQPGCAMCGSGRGRLEDVRVIATTNRNFENRQGRATRTHLASPATVAASAIAGRIADPR